MSLLAYLVAKETGERSHCGVNRMVSLGLERNGICESIYISAVTMVAGELSTLQWRHNDHDCFSNHQPHDCLLNRLFRRRSMKTSKLCVTGLCVGTSPGPVNSPHKWPVTWKMFPFDDVIMITWIKWDDRRGWVDCFRTRVSYWVSHEMMNFINISILISVKLNS